MARDGALARRHRGSRFRDPYASARVGGERARRWVRRSARRLQILPGPLSRRQAAGRALPAEAEQEAGRAQRVPADGAASVQPDVQDAHGSGGGHLRRDLSAPRNGAGIVREFSQRAAGVAAESAVRHRADREGIPQRNHAGEFHLPHARIRADGVAVLR